MTQHYIGTKIIEAWPAQKDGVDGYSVKYADGYTSWSPKDVFEAAYLPLGHISHLPPHVQRMVGELAELDDRHGKLAGFLKTSAFLGLSEDDRNDLSAQFLHMADYGNVLRRRVDRAIEQQTSP